jgi:putative DNA primase/helicase
MNAALPPNIPPHEAEAQWRATNDTTPTVPAVTNSDPLPASAAIYEAAKAATLAAVDALDRALASRELAKSLNIQDSLCNALGFADPETVRLARKAVEGAEYAEDEAELDAHDEAEHLAHVAKLAEVDAETTRRIARQEAARAAQLASGEITNAVPEAKRLCTDQANAERLQKHYKDQLIVCAGVFFTWGGTHWKINNGLARLLACNLSRIVEAEATAAHAEAKAARQFVDSGALSMYDQDPKANRDLVAKTPPGRAFLELVDKWTSLVKWTARCESAATQDAALRILKDLLTVDSAKLDADDYAFNCANGTIDLRTGKLREHRASDLITKIAPTRYDPTAKCPRFLKFLDQIFEGNRPVVDFVQRFYGYAMTADTKEQILMILWGKGSNGKTTLVETISSVYGDYASSAASGLLTGKGGNDNNHYAEIADLHGRRLVTASESEEGAKLKEAFMKKAVGGDKLKGRHLYGQLFEFIPKHTLQMLTNYKPQIKGTGYATWRRIRLLPFLVKFGTAAEVEGGKAQFLKDLGLAAALLAERDGILAWCVEGARLWHESSGLEAPAIMVKAAAEYQSEQDRVGQFLAECCTLNRDAITPVALLYSAYTGWCKAEGLDYPLTRQKLLDELRADEIIGDTFKHREARCVKGVELGEGASLMGAAKVRAIVPAPSAARSPENPWTTPPTKLPIPPDRG